MRILHLLADRKLPRDPDNEAASGVVHAALEIARAQAGLGHETSVAAIDRETWRAEWKGVRLIGLRAAHWARVKVNEREIDLSQHLPYILFTRRQAFDLVQAHHSAYMRFLRARGRVVHFHVDPLQHKNGNGNYALKPADFASIVQHSDAQVAVSRFVAQEVERGLKGSGNLHIVYNGVEEARFDPRRWAEEGLRLRREWGVEPGDVVFLYAGAVVPEKGTIHLARAFARLAAGMTRVRLVLAGAAELWGGALQPLSQQKLDYENEVKLILQAPGVAEKVHLLGKVPHLQMPALYAASDALVAPSVYREPFGLVAVEALASGRPVIASATGGLVEVVNERVGALVPPGDELGLEAAMRRLVEYPGLRNALGREARRSVQRFSWDAAAQQLDGIYRSILARKAGR